VEHPSDSGIETRNEFDEIESIVAALHPYLDAARTGDGSGMSDIWLDEARLISVRGGEPLVTTPREFWSEVDRYGASPKVRSRVTSIERAGNVASVRINFADWRHPSCTAFLLLVRTHERWVISAQVFDTQGG